MVILYKAAKLRKAQLVHADLNQMPGEECYARNQSFNKATSNACESSVRPVAAPGGAMAPPARMIRWTFPYCGTRRAI